MLSATICQNLRQAAERFGCPETKCFTMKTALITVSAALLLTSAASAQAPSVAGSSNDWMSVSALSSQLEAQGYTVLEVDRDDGRYEVEMRDTNGVKYEAKINRITGEIIEREREDD